MGTVAALAEGRLRIAMVSTPFVSVPPAGYGGTELVVSELVNGLSRLGHEVVLFATGDSRAPCEVRALHPTPVWPPAPLPELAHASFAADEIRRAPGRFDLVHAHVPSFLAFAPLLGDVPVVHTLHHGHDPAFEAYCAALRAETSPIAISARQAASYASLSPTVIHHGLSGDAYPLGAEGRGHLAFLGRLSRVKGPDVAIDVAHEVGRPLVVGGGDHAEDDDDYAAALAARLAQPHVRLLGEVAHARKVELLATADALLFPIRWEEPFGLVMLEAMLCGCPVVAFRGGAVEELVEEGATGFVADDARHMAALVRERVPRLDRRAVRERALERFSAARMVADHLALYRAVVSRRSAAAWTEAAAP